MTLDICRGCGLINYKFISCAFATHSLQEHCPCIECLVKVTCREACDHRTDIKIDIFQHRSKKPHKGRTLE